MPAAYVVVVNPDEKDLINRLWPKPEEGEPRILGGNAITFHAEAGRKILARLLDAPNAMAEMQTMERLVGRIAIICGKTLLEPSEMPVVECD